LSGGVLTQGTSENNRENCLDQPDNIVNQSVGAKECLEAATNEKTSND
jgi:hypothetical protein